MSSGPKTPQGSAPSPTSPAASTKAVKQANASTNVAIRGGTGASSSSSFPSTPGAGSASSKGTPTTPPAPLTGTTSSSPGLATASATSKAGVTPPPVLRPSSAVATTNAATTAAAAAAATSTASSPSAAAAAAAPVAPLPAMATVSDRTPTTHNASENDEADRDRVTGGEPRERGWVPVDDGRFRVALTHRFCESGSGDVRSDGCPSAFTGMSPEEPCADDGAADASTNTATCGDDDEAAAACGRSPTNDALCNRCRADEPHIEVSVEASLVNAISSAYTSTGYPFVVTAGNARGAVYGSFVDLSNPSLSSLELPPAQTIIVAPSFAHAAGSAPSTAADAGGSATASGAADMDTLLAVRWSRGDRIMTTAGVVSAAAVSAAASHGAGNSGTGNAAAHGKQTLTAGASAAGGAASLVGGGGAVAAGPAGAPHSPAVARTIAHHLMQFPEGIHGIHSSPALRQLLVDGELPTTQASAPVAAVNAAANAPATGSGGAGRSGEFTAASGAGDGAPAGTPTSAHPQQVPAAPSTANSEANLPPLPLPPQSNAPVQHTLVSASTFNHVSIYLTAHQDGKLLYTAPIQSLSASIATRKVTAHQLILVGREEVDATPADAQAAMPTKPQKRTRVPFTDVQVPGSDAAAAVFFQGKSNTRFVGADARRRTVSAAAVRFTVEPHLLMGNQNGDIFVFSLLQERVVQQINYNAGTANVSPSIASGNSGVGSKLICSPVSCIAEVQNGMEKKIASMVEYAMVAKRNRRSTFDTDDIPTGFAAAGAAAATPTHYYYPVPPSLYAVGFDNGQLLLICVTCEGGWMLRHFSSHYFGVRPIHAISVRVPNFYTRLWTSYLPPITAAATRSGSTAAASASVKPVSTLVTAESALLVHEEEQHIAAIACNGGVIALVRLPGMEILSSVAPTDYNAVGEILALQWTSTSPLALLTPDILVASGEDDTMTAFQLLTQFLVSAADSNGSPAGPHAQHHHYLHAHSSSPFNNNNDNASHISSTESILGNGRLRILEKKRFHRSWVSRLHLLPVVMPALASASSNAASGVVDDVRVINSGGAAAAGATLRGQSKSGGMPQYLGVCLVATSYDHRTSFWPWMFSGASAGHESGAAYADTRGLDRADSLMMGFSSTTAPPSVVSGPITVAATAAATAAAAGSGVGGDAEPYVLLDGPTTAYPLHTELVIGVGVAGGGTSFFLTTVCCRGKVKFWSMQVRA